MPDLGAIEPAEGKTAEYHFIAEDVSPGVREDTRFIIGGRDAATGGKCIPQVALERWWDEKTGDYHAWLSINHPDRVDAETEAFADNKISLSVGSNTHEIYEKPGGIIAHDVSMARAWGSSSVAFDIKKSAGVSLNLQPPLSQAEIDEGCQRPENVVWSIAVYADRANGRFKTGKLCHIYRPKWTDAEKRESWGWWEIDEGAGQIIAWADERWLAEAAYPVRLDPDVGYSSEGASISDFYGPPRTIWANLNATQPEDGTVDSVSYCPGNTASGLNFIIGIDDFDTVYECDPDNNASITSGSWKTGTLAGTTELSSGDTYHVLFGHDTVAIKAKYDTEAGGGYGFYQNNDVISCGDNYVYDQTSTYGTRRISAYYSYSTSGSAQNLTVQDLLHAHGLESPALSAALALAAGDLTHAHSLESPALSATLALAVDDGRACFSPGIA